MDVFNNRLPLTIEEAYAVMLSPETPLEHYQTYAHLARLGYTLFRHNHPYGAVLTQSSAIIIIYVWFWFFFIYFYI